MAHHRLVGLFGDVQLHPNSAVAGGGHGFHEGLIGDEVRANQLERVLGVVRYGGKQTQVRLRGEAGAGGHDLHDVRAGILVVRIQPLLGIGGVDEVQFLVGFGEPVHGEHRVDGADDRAGKLRHYIHPLAADLVVLRLLVRGLDHVLRAHEGHPAVHDHQLAVVAQIGAAEAPLERLQGQHDLPVHAHGLQPLTQLLVALVLVRADVVPQHAHGHSALRGPAECFEEGLGRIVPGHDVNFDVHVIFGRVDRAGHRGDRFLVVRMQGLHGAVHSGKCRELPVEPYQGSQLVAELAALGNVRLVGAHRADQFVRLVLDAVASPVDRRRSHQQE